MKITKELKNLPVGELKERLQEFKKELLKLKSSAATGANPSNPGKLKQVRKNIARTLMLISEKEGLK